jgi:hypothetical protein
MVKLTLPVDVSIRMAFFCGSTTSWPASVGTTLPGGTWRRPGPSLRGFLGCEGMSLGSIESPGRTKIASEDIATGGLRRREALLLGEYE